MFKIKQFKKEVLDDPHMLMEHQEISNKWNESQRVTDAEIKLLNEKMKNTKVREDAELFTPVELTKFFLNQLKTLFHNVLHFT